MDPGPSVESMFSVTLSPREALMQDLIKYLLSPMAVKIVDVSLHYVYWSVLHPYALNHPQISGCVEVARERVESGRGGIVAHVTEEDDEGVIEEVVEGEGGERRVKRGRLLKEMEDAEALMGVGKLEELRLGELEGEAMQGIALEMNRTWEEVRGSLKVDQGVEIATSLYMPVLICSIRNAVDNVLGSRYPYLTRSVKWSNEEIIQSFGSPSEVWDMLHGRLTSILDPTGYASHLSCFNGVRGGGIRKSRGGFVR